MPGVFITHAAELAPKSSQGKRTPPVEPSTPQRHEGSRPLGLVARFSLRVREVPGSIPGAAPRQGAQPNSLKVEALAGPLVAQDDPRLAAWPSGAQEVPGSIPGAALSRPARKPLSALRQDGHKLRRNPGSNRGLSDLSLTLPQQSHRGGCEGQGALTGLGQARRPMLCHCAASV